MRYALFILFVMAILEFFSIHPHRYQIPKTTSGKIRKGVIHAHSVHSDGGGTVKEIADAASEANLDFVILTDHNTTNARRAGEEKRYGEVDVFVETEASTVAGHAVAFYSHTKAVDLPDSEIPTAAYEHFSGQKKLDPNAFVAIAHPSNLKRPWDRLDIYPDGLEVINFDSSWRREAVDSVSGFVFTLLSYPFNNYLGVLRFLEVYPKDLNYWDTMNGASPPHFGYLGHDAHSKLVLNNKLFLRWPDYAETFKIASNVVFLEKEGETFEERKSELYKSIRKGKMAILFQVMHPFEGNFWHFSCGKSKFEAGSVVRASDRCSSEIGIPKDFPYPVRVDIWKDGNLWKSLNDNEWEKPIPISEEGTYRVEVWAKPRSLFHLALNSDIPYLLYNPIFVR